MVARLAGFTPACADNPAWLQFTSDQYYRLRIRKVLDSALDVLEREPRRVFSVESLFFLQQYWERQPEQRSRPSVCPADLARARD